MWLRHRWSSRTLGRHCVDISHLYRAVAYRFGAADLRAGLTSTASGRADTRVQLAGRGEGWPAVVISPLVRDLVSADSRTA